MWWVIIIETIVITIVGCLLHFTYGWSHQNKLVAVFSAVNESTWEHIKLALSGIFVCMLGDVWFLGDNENYWLARSASFVVPVIVIPAIFYGYNFCVKHTILPVDIGMFVVAAFLSSLAFELILQAPSIGFWGGLLSMIISVIIIALYLLLTKFPFHNFLFEDPITHDYGYDGHRVRQRRKTNNKG